jgi:hypothetical protein
VCGEVSTGRCQYPVVCGVLGDNVEYGLFTFLKVAPGVGAASV